MLLIFVAYMNYLVDCYLMYAASAIAANTIARSACGAAAPLFTNYMFSALGVGGGGSLIGGVAVLLACIPFVFYKYGKQIRIRSRFAPAPDARSQEKSDEESRLPEAIKGPESQSGENENPASQAHVGQGVERG
jgi:DHA1 family multidrug resistance protein-like MFS transporter